MWFQLIIYIFGRTVHIDHTNNQSVTCLKTQLVFQMWPLFTDLQYAQCMYACTHVCDWQILLGESIDSGVRDCEGLSPAMWACRSDRIDHFNLLTSYQHEQNATRQADHQSGVDERDLAGRTCLHWSVRRVEPLECLRVCFSD